MSSSQIAYPVGIGVTMLVQRIDTAGRAAVYWLLVAVFFGCHAPQTSTPATTHFDRNGELASSLPSTLTPVRGSGAGTSDGETQRDGTTQVVLAAMSSQDESPWEADLTSLIQEALSVNPQIRRLEAEAAAAWQRVPQVQALPDPMVQASGFTVPQFMADGEMWATLMVSQTIPYLRQLDARGQQASFEALALEAEAQSARLRITAEVEESWYRLYLLGQLLRINEANRQLIKPLIEVATGRVKVGETAPGDVVLGTLELSRAEEERLMLHQQLTARKAFLNRLLNRPSDAPVEIPPTIPEKPVRESIEQLRMLAFERQPEIVATRWRTEATAWGIRVARWERIPQVTVLYEHMFMDMNPGEQGPNPQRVGLTMNIPLWRRKYLAMELEARQENIAAYRGVEEARREYDAMLLELLEEARAAEKTARLYQETILPQARQAVEVDQLAYAQGTVTFERTIGDVRNLLTADSAYHRALADRAIALARLRAAAGGQLPSDVQ